MKKYSLLIVFIIIYAVSPAQENQKITPSQGAAELKVLANESVEMKEGKIWFVKDGKTTLVSKDVTLGGTRVTADGVVYLKDGTRKNMKEGDKVNADGSISKAAPVNKMDLKPEY